jgi:hypothetical protein
MVLTNVLLRAPRRPREGDAWESATHLLAPELPTMAEPPWPLVGIANDDKQVVVLLAHEFDVDLAPIQTLLGISRPIGQIVTGEIRPASRPALGGDSISGDGTGGETGTLACAVKNADGDTLVLGCNHTLAGVNSCVVNRGTVRQPGAAAGGAHPSDRLGKLTDYRTIALGGYHPNVMDAAVAEPDDPSYVAAGVRTMGPIAGVGVPPTFGEPLHKVGWATGHTLGAYRYRLSFTMSYPGIGTALFVDQYGIVGSNPGQPVAAQGDSGAAVLTDGSNELVGLVIGIADGMNMAIASPIHPILQAFGVTPET